MAVPGGCSACRQVRWSQWGRCARRGPWGQRPGPGSATDRGGRGGLWPVRGTGRGQSRSGRVGTEPPHCAPRAQPWTPARASGRGSQGGVRGGCPGAAEDTGRQGRQPRPALAAASGRWDSCVLLAVLDAEGPCGGARQVACDTGAPQGAAGAAGAQDTRRSGATRQQGRRSHWRHVCSAGCPVAWPCPRTVSPPRAGFPRSGAAEARVPECPPAPAPKGALLSLLICQGALCVCIPVFWGNLV